MDRFRRFLVSDHAAGWAFILPSVILVAVFGIFPIVWGLILSFQKAGLISPDREWVGLEQLRAIAERPRRGRRPSTRSTTRCCSCRSRSWLAVHRARAEPQDRVRPLLPARGVHPGRHVDDRHRDHVPVAVRPELRARQLAARQDRARAVRVLRGADPGDDLARPDDRVGLARVRHDHLPRRAAGGPAGADRGGAIDGAEPVEHVLARHVADARAGDAAARRVVDDQRAPAVRRGVLRDQGRAARPDVASWSSTSTAWRSSRGSAGLSLAGYAAAIAYVLFLVILVLTLAQFWLGHRVVHYSS